MQSHHIFLSRFKRNIRLLEFSLVACSVFGWGEIFWECIRKYGLHRIEKCHYSAFGAYIFKYFGPMRLQSVLMVSSLPFSAAASSFFFCSALSIASKAFIIISILRSSLDFALFLKELEAS